MALIRHFERRLIFIFPPSSPAGSPRIRQFALLFEWLSNGRSQIVPKPMLHSSKHEALRDFVSICWSAQGVDYYKIFTSLMFQKISLSGVAFGDTVDEARGYGKNISQAVAASFSHLTTSPFKRRRSAERLRDAGYPHVVVPSRLP